MFALIYDFLELADDHTLKKAYIVQWMEALAGLPAFPGLVKGGVEPEGNGGDEGG